MFRYAILDCVIGRPRKAEYVARFKNPPSSVTCVYNFFCYKPKLLAFVVSPLLFTTFRESVTRKFGFFKKKLALYRFIVSSGQTSIDMQGGASFSNVAQLLIEVIWILNIQVQAKLYRCISAWVEKMQLDKRICTL